MKVAICIVALYLVTVNADTECQKRRQQALDRPLLGQLIPECEENGDFAALQCHHDRFCQCWRRDGTAITLTSRQIKHCECLRQVDDYELRQINSESQIVGAFVPSCRADGFFDSLQCHPSTGLCWCGNKFGDRLSQPSRTPVNC